MKCRRPALWSPDPQVRLAAGAELSDRRRAQVLERVGGWPAGSTGCAGGVNAWLLLCSTKPPVWSEPPLAWRDLPPTLGPPHTGFFHPDPLHCWSEIRRWSAELLGPRLGDVPAHACLSLTAVVHLGDHPERLAWARRVMRPGLVLFLDEAAWEAAGLSLAERATYPMIDPHRLGQRYEGFWAVDGEGTVIGKAPQHPAANRLYRPEDLTGFLSSAPRPVPAAGRGGATRTRRPLTLAGSW